MTATSRPLLALAALALGCGGDATISAPPAGAALGASKLAVLAVGVAVAPQGRSFFDNFLPCPRRGVIAYRNSAQGRHATFSGCDAGDGVVVDGTAEIRWTQPGGDRERIETIDVVGPLTVRVAGAQSVVDGIRVSNVSFVDRTEPTVLSLVVAPVRVSAAGETTPLEPTAVPSRVFEPSLTIDSLPNPTGSLDALTDADLRRIAYHGALALASILFNETLEIQRGAHTHTEPCGTMAVVPDVARNLPHLDMRWTACDVRAGLFESGTFAVDWTEFDMSAGRLSMVAQGALTLGGGVPKVTLSRLEWNVTGLRALPTTIRISGRLVSGSQQRSYSFDVAVDD